MDNSSKLKRDFSPAVPPKSDERAKFVLRDADDPWTEGLAAVPTWRTACGQ